MPDAQRTMTAAENFVRSMFDDRTSREADLGVLAMERALIRGGHRFRHLGTLDLPDWRISVVPASADVSHDAEIVSVIVQDEIDGRHVADWIVASCRHDAPWLSRLDEQGRPLKLMKIGSLARAKHEADRDMRRKAADMGSTVLVAGEEILHADLGDGWSLVRLLTPAALDLESGRMQHCIGQGAYDDALSDGGTTFLSLRGPSGRPHATMEIVAEGSSPPRMVQFQGRQNRQPIERHVRRVRNWLKTNVKQTASDMSYLWWSRKAKGGVGGDVDFDAPASEADLRQSVHLVLYEGDVLPTALLKTGNHLHIEIGEGRISPVQLPDAVFSTSSIVLKGPGVFVLGGSFRTRSLEAEGCRLENLPADFLVADTMTATDCTVDLFPSTARAKTLKLPRSDARFESGFTALQLDLSSSRVSELPAGLRVSDLQVENCPLKEIPDGCGVVNLTVRGRDLARIGRNDTLDMLALYDTASDLELPERLELPWGLKLRGPGFPSRLPTDLRVGKELDVWNTEGLVLPSGLDVDALVLRERGFASLPDGTRIRGTLKLSRCEHGIDVGENCEIGSIRATGRIEVVEEGKVVQRTVDVDWDPTISRIEPDGSVEKRNAAPSM